MSDINYAVSLSVNKPGFNKSLSATSAAELNSAGFLAVTLNLGTATAAINTAAAGSLGLCLAQNLSTSTASTATVSFGRLSGTALFETVRLRPGEAALLRLSPGNYGARAAAATTTLLLQVLED